MPCPDKNAQPTAANVEAFTDHWTSLISDHPGVDDPCSFYVAVDNYLGPWGSKGYPIGYGLFYCRLFGSNERLQKDRVAAEWSKKTRIRLQEMLRDFLVAEFKAGRLPSLTEERLRKAAFDSHPQCYREGGLRHVVESNPWLVPIIVAIPSEEFKPESGTAGATWWQALVTTVAVGGEVFSNFWIGTLNEGEDEWLAQDRLPRTLQQLRDDLRRGKFDNLGVLERLVRALRSRAYPTQALRLQASTLVQEVEGRMAVVRYLYRQIDDNSPIAAPELKDMLNGLCRGGFYSCPADVVPSREGRWRSPGPLGQ